jgi:hypothetical protein
MLSQIKSPADLKKLSAEADKSVVCRDQIIPN